MTMCHLSYYVGESERRKWSRNNLLKSTQALWQQFVVLLMSFRAESSSLWPLQIYFSSLPLLYICGLFILPTIQESTLCCLQSHPTFWDLIQYRYLEVFVKVGVCLHKGVHTSASIHSRICQAQLEWSHIQCPPPRTASYPSGLAPPVQPESIPLGPQQ